MQINLLRKLDLTERGERGKGLFLLRSVTPFLLSGLGSRGERRLFLLLLLLPLKQMGRLSSSPKSSFSHLFLSHPWEERGEILLRSPSCSMSSFPPFLQLGSSCKERGEQMSSCPILGGGKWIRPRDTTKFSRATGETLWLPLLLRSEVNFGSS